MATIQIKRSHAMGREQVRAEVQRLADKLANDLGASYQWQGDRLSFERSGAKGSIQVSDGAVEIEVTLGMLLAPLKGKVEKTVTDYLDRHLA